MPVRDLDKPFLMPVEDSFSIPGRGTVITGSIERGVIKKGEEVELLGLGKHAIKTTATGLNVFFQTVMNCLLTFRIFVLKY